MDMLGKIERVCHYASDVRPLFLSQNNKEAVGISTSQTSEREWF
jgi:hypothetical protein